MITANFDPPVLDDPVEKLPGVSEQSSKKLRNLGVNTIKDLLELIPRRMEDRSQLVPIDQLIISHPSVIIGIIESVHSRKSKRGILMVQAKIRDESGTINALWFNQRYLLGQLVVGSEIMLFGEKRIVPSLGNPFFVKKIISSLEVAPIYPSSGGLYQATIRRLIAVARPMIRQFKNIVPDSIRVRYRLPSRSEAIEAVHFSEDLSSLARAKELLAFEELLVLSTQVLQAKQDRFSTKTKPIEVDIQELKKIVATFPYKLTDGQRRSAWQIVQDLTLDHPMYRLLYGEVGSGKTAIAMIASAVICRSGAQVVWLNPTAILATQQVENLRKILKPLELKIAQVSASIKEDHINADIIVGTHALLEPKIKFKNLGLVIIDEQHRFGVEQRQLILDRYPTTHLLMMSATPIPRSLAQSIFGHLDITYLLDKPIHQKPIDTVIVTENNRALAEREIEKRIKSSQPGFVICPLIYGSSLSTPTLFAAERKAVIAEEKRLKNRYPSARIGVIHGRIRSEEREEIIRRFKTGLIDILLSTSMVEIGIDNQAATWILVEEADRFGLAQLHQLRGRVGRGAQASICYIVQSVETVLAKKRLEVLTQTTEGLKIAEADLELRGPGELVGLEQSGLPELKYASLTDELAIKSAFIEAGKILEEGLDRYPPLKQEVLKLKNGKTQQNF